MKVSKYIKRDCPRISIDADVKKILDNLECGQCFVVIKRDGEVAGIISYTDKCYRNAPTMADVLTNKPVLAPEDSLEDAVATMTTFGTDCLPVYKGKEFLGVIFQNSIALGLVNQVFADKKVYRNVIHDLRTSIANISGLNSLLAKNISEPENIELLELSANVTDHSLAILQTLLVDGEKEDYTYNMEYGNLIEFLQECVGEMKGRAYAKNIDLSYSGNTDTFLYSFNPTKFKRVIQNLLSNALKFTNKGGSVAVTATVTEKTCKIAVTDTGIGIPIDQQSLIFEQYTPTAHNGTEGEKSTGLGLHYVKSCVKQMNGLLNFVSEQGIGSTFYITLSE